MRKQILFITILVAIFQIVQASDQVVKYGIVENKSLIEIEGTSNLHDWKMKFEQFEIEFTAKKNENTFIGIKDIRFSCKSENIQASEKIVGKGVMESKARKALKAKKYPEITAVFSHLDTLDNQGNQFYGKLTGALTIAGQARQVQIPFTGELKDDGRLNLQGQFNLLMPDFGISPPKAMFGTLKTGDEIKVYYNFIFKSL